MTVIRDAAHLDVVERPPARIPSLTGLRFFAAFLVFLDHGQYLGLFANQSIEHGYEFLGGNVGALGVSFFFVLSGFVLTWVHRPGDTATAFWRRRFFKIVPNHLIVFAVAISLLFASGEVVHIGPAIANLFLVQPWAPDPDFVIYTVNGVTWTLGVELLFYASFPLIVRGVARIRPERLWAWVFGAAGTSLLIPALTMLLVPGTGESFNIPGLPWMQQWIVAFLPLARIPEFVAGMLLARVVREGRWIRLGVAPAALLTVAVYALTLFVPPLFKYAAFYPLPLGLLAASIAVREAAGRKSFLRTPVMGWLGESSYAFFVVQLVVLFTTQALLNGGQLPGYGMYEHVPWSTPVALLFLAGTLGLSVLLGGLLFTFVERPIMRRWARARRPRDGVSPA
ncbi:acyltransferase family protein [Amycolatopsis sp. NPDC004747]